MKSFIFKMVFSFLCLLFCAYVGVNELMTNRTGTGIFTLFLAATNLLCMWLHWIVYKKEKELE